MRLGNTDALSASSYSGTIFFRGGAFAQGTVNDFSANFSSEANQQFKIRNIGTGTLTYASPLVSEGGSLELLGGFLTLEGDNTYSGATTVTNGYLQVGNGDVSSPAGSLSDVTSVHIAGSGEYRPRNHDVIGSISGDGTIDLGYSPSWNLTVGGNNSDSTFSGHISGNGTLIKAGSGTLTFDLPSTDGSSSIDIDNSLQIESGKLLLTTSENLPLQLKGSVTKAKPGAATFEIESPTKNLTIDTSITSAAGAGPLHVKAKSGWSILLDDSESINTKGGDIVFWANSSNKQSGFGEHYIRLEAGSSLNSSGGNIVLAGGLDSNSDGYPDGFAYIGGYVTPPAGNFEGGALQPGLSLGSVRDQQGALISINSGGGDIVMRGRSGVAQAEADGFGSQRALVIDSGTGTIEIIGDQVSSSGGVGLRFGGFGYYPDVAITSASTSTPAIDVTGSSINRAGIWLGQGNTNSNLAGTVLIQSSATSGGGITIAGSSAQTTDGHRGIALWGDTSGHAIPNEYQFLSNNGPIEFQSRIDSVNSQIGFWSDTYLATRKDSTPVQGVVPIEGSSNVKSVFRADNWVSFMDNIRGSGSIEVYPFTLGRSVGIYPASTDFKVESLDNLADTFSSVTIGDDSYTNGVT